MTQSTLSSLQVLVITFRLRPSRPMALSDDAPDATVHLPSRHPAGRSATLAACRPAMADAYDQDRDRNARRRKAGFRQPTAGGKTQRAARPGPGGRKFWGKGAGGGGT